MSRAPDLSELKDISHDIETFNRVIVDAHQYVHSEEEGSQAFGARRFELLRAVLKERLFEAATNNPLLHLELVTGKNGIPVYELLKANENERVSNVDARPIGGIAAWSTVKLDSYEGDGEDFSVISRSLRFRLDSIGQTIFDGGRLMVIDDTPIPDEPSANV